MFKPAKMKKLKIITLDQYADSVVKSLHESGLVQIYDISERIQQDAEWKQILRPSHATPFLGKISSLLMKVTGTADFLDSVSKKDEGILTIAKGFINPPQIEKKEVEQVEVEKLLSNAEEILNQVESQTNPLEEKLNELETENSRLKNAINVAENLIKFDVNIGDLAETKYVSVIAGKIALDSFKQFKEGMKDLPDEIVVFDNDSTDKEFKILLVVTLKQNGDKIASLLRKLEFERFELTGLSGKPEEIIENSESEIESIAKEKELILNNLAEISAEWHSELLVLKELLEIEKQRSEIFSSFGETENTVMFEGWVTKKNLEKTLGIIENMTDGHSIVDVSDPDVDKDKIPVHLDNPRFAKPYEMFVHMYSPPDYREFDPTILMAIIFPFFFGYCLTDAGYGIVDAILGLIIFRGLGRNSKLMSNIGLILIACGAWAFILGMVTNGFIGDLFPRWILGAPLPTTIGAIDAFVHPEIILVIALIVGVLHINMGLLIGSYNNITRGDVREALGSQIVWFVLEAGIIILALFYISGSMMSGAIFGGPIILLSLIMLIYFNGAFGLMDLTGFLGTILSYARLLALCLSTGGIAMTVNILTGLCESMIPVIGIVLAPIVFIGGHIANCAFQSLGAFINSLRLHYVEYFAQFYIGGSQKFKAFRTKRRHTELGGK
ncbi:V-type ATP synthase subunit I [Methanobacterium sp. SMA-27]|uniref:V-type ATP synthase subunit I n=1 Tax=Methanobacterium sp. SMA-27 TaxID=1495336 RepID=UPI00064FC306|nr:V-type ATP synthase subunit I [Methanobacterium sp. SMA-27]